MTELTKEEFEKSLMDEADEAAVDNYLSIDRNEILGLAAALSPRRETIDQAVEEAAKLSAGVAREIPLQRRKLLLSMNFNTLMMLLGRIGYNLPMYTQDRHITGDNTPSGMPEADDPIKGPVFAMIQHRLPNLPKDLRRERQLEIETAITTASNRTDVRYPGLPCDLEVALQWAADAPDVPYNTLKRAFIDYLETWHEDESVPIDLLEDYSGQLKMASGRQDRLDDLKYEIALIKDRLAFIKVVKGYRSFFKPGKTNAPKEVIARVQKIMATVWDQPYAVQTRSMLADLADNFHPFWQKHAQSYQKLAEAKSTTNKVSGKGGPTSRMRPIWVSRTDRFVAFARGHKIPPCGSEEWEQFFEEFSQMEPEKKRTQKKISAFMKTLVQHGTKPLTDELIDQLKAEKINAVDRKTLRTCSAKVGAVIPTFLGQDG